jgi:hypothetical protein
MQTRACSVLTLVISVLPVVARAECRSNRVPIYHATATPSSPPCQQSVTRAKDPPRSDDPLSVTKWYGWQTLAVDAGTLGVALTTKGATGSSPAALGVLASGYALGGPIVHLAHGSLIKAGESFGLRLALPVIGGLIGAAFERCAFQCTGGIYTVTGVLIGYVAAVAIDSAVIARERVVASAPLSFTMTLGHRSAWAGIALRL